MARTKVNTKPMWQKKFEDSIKNIFFSSQSLPIILSLILISVLFVLFRMKGVELSYESLEVKGKIEHSVQENKSLKAKKARLLSSKNLKKMARKHNLSDPTTKQIIVIPDGK